MGGGKERLLGVQYLRAVAALMVAYYHLIHQIPAYSSYLSATEWIRTAALPAGVHVFFVISGFVMYISALDSRPLDFARRRMIRIIPLYWFLTLAVAALAIAVPHLLRSTDYSPIYLLKSLAFIPYVNPHGMIAPMLIPGWSLNYEMFFYAIFALALFSPLSWRLPTLIVVIGALWSIGKALGSTPQNATYTSPLLLLFLLGVLIGWMYRRGMLAARGVSVLMVLAGFFALIGPLHFGTTVNFGASAAVVWGAVSLDASGSTPSLPWLALLGDASYSLYLVHIFAFGVTRAAWKHVHLGGESGAAAFAMISMLTAVAFALGTYHLIERPSLRFLTRKPARLFKPSMRPRLRRLHAARRSAVE